MTFTARGACEGIPYEIRVGDDGRITGSVRVAEVLASHEGQAVSATPTSSAAPLDLTSDAGVLIGLRAFTRLGATSGDVPDVDSLDADVPADAVF